MHRKLSGVFLTLLILIPVALLAQAPANRAATEKQILAAERAVNEAFAKADLKNFHASLAADAVILDGAGVAKVNTPDFDKMMQSAKIQSWNIDSSQFYWINDNSVIHMYRWTGKGTFAGQPLPSPTWASTVWTNRGGKWVATFHQETLSQPAPAPAKK